MGFYQWLHLMWMKKRQNSPEPREQPWPNFDQGIAPLSTLSSTVLTPLSHLSARAAGRQITPRVISLSVLNIPPNSPHWIYGNDLEKLLNS